VPADPNDIERNKELIDQEALIVFRRRTPTAWTNKIKLPVTKLKTPARSDRRNKSGRPEIRAGFRTGNGVAV